MPSTLEAASRIQERSTFFRLLPSLADVLFGVMLAVLFASANGGWMQLLGDGDTGWHIRTGEWILRNHTVPHTDLFSFSKPGAPWFAWEWLADIVFAAAYASQGLKGVVIVSALTICASLLILFRYLLWRGSGIAVALMLCMLVADASQVHYLARPHVFTLLLLPVALWLLDRDRQTPTPAVWLLVPLAALWTNLHGGFLALLVLLFLWTAGAFLRNWTERTHKAAFGAARRHLLLTSACVAATFVNPYGYHLHSHVITYIRSDWIAKNVDEFQPPRIRSEGMYKFEAMLFLGLGLTAVLIRARKYEEPLQIGFWAHAALQSTRHIPLFMIAAAPAVGSEVGKAVNRYASGQARASAVGALYQLLSDFNGSARRNTLWLAGIAALLWFFPGGPRWPQDFPSRFPSAMVGRNAAFLAPAVDRERPRILTSDEWGSYLIYREFPRVRVFMDGRSDFYGPEVGNDYICLMRGCEKWPQIFDRWRFDTAMLPGDWPLVPLLSTRPDWRVVDRDRTAVLFRRVHPQR